jgi:hypothetical protein
MSKRHLSEQRRCKLSHLAHWSDAPCIHAQGAVNADGYVFMHDARTGEKSFAHRIAWKEAVGPVGSEFEIHHLCHNRRCINPKHLQKLTHEAHVALHEQERSTSYFAWKDTSSYRELRAKITADPKPKKLPWWKKMAIKADADRRAAMKKSMPRRHVKPLKF